ncbi:hypothetical protein PUNSTDRAFT_140452 [Punctularia strigosozonata HHB-11173 SS5]|uniref:uncharacterized protein n=1 Tax=Punctularia strigosozonata (strain HHB-11173) TaxID=741275 RepID=UPI0004416909|nr:uncharacterized protein PUNSTDRAFT_140452 [Punctularia strigosozonata HHB-11173 SS5]EIN14073.1 hypothetical protein PUNSTDRAFT_140452 [Punctularia strigosozonata HHB-11173 SS5]
MDDSSDSQGGTLEDEDDGESTVEADEPRMSYLGPKMKVHSKAPWETDDHDADSDTSSHFRGTSSHKRTKTKTAKGDGIMKGLGFMGRNVPRPSMESSRSSSSGNKKSFETSSSISTGGALQALAQASMPTSSLAYGTTGLRPANESDSSLIRNRVASTSTPTNPSLQIPAVSPRAASIRSFDSSPHPQGRRHIPPSFKRQYSDGTDTRPFAPASTRTSESQDEYAHPYANPDLAIYNRDSVRAPSPPLGRERGPSEATITPSDSNATVTDSSLFSPSRTMDPNVLTPATSMSSSADQDSDSRSGQSRLYGKTISPPMALNTSRRLDGSQGDERDMLIAPGVHGVHAWQASPTSQSFSLISLEEAQAQARERSRSATANATFHGSFPAAVAFPDSDSISIRSTNTADASPTLSTARARSRTTSAGTKAKRAFQGFTSDASRDDTPKAGIRDPAYPEASSSGQKALRHKKSGFMRLFREKAAPISLAPPVPQLSELHLQTNQNAVRTIPRVPVPSISPSLLVDPDPGSAYMHPNESGASQGSTGSTPTSEGTTRRTSPRPPPLTIVTSNRGSSPRTADPTKSTSPNSPRDRNIPYVQSAPADQTTFEALRLRPVSQVFSQHFVAHIGSANSSPPHGAELDTPTTTSATLASPVSCEPSPHAAIAGTGLKHGIADDSSSVIQALQSQIASAKMEWQRQVWELEAEVRSLRAEVEHLRGAEAELEYCDVCGRGSPGSVGQPNATRGSVINRPRARTGTGGRFTVRD